MTKKRRRSSAQPVVKLEKIYFVHKPLTINSPSLPETVNSSGRVEDDLTRGEFFGVLKRVSRPEASPPDEEKSET